MFAIDKRPAVAFRNSRAVMIELPAIVKLRLGGSLFGSGGACLLSAEHQQDESDNTEYGSREKQPQPHIGKELVVNGLGSGGSGGSALQGLGGDVVRLGSSLGSRSGIGVVGLCHSAVGAAVEAASDEHTTLDNVIAQAEARYGFIVPFVLEAP